MRTASLTHTMLLKDKLKWFELSVKRYRNFKDFSSNLSLYGLIKVDFSILREIYLTKVDVDVSVYENVIRKNILKIIKDRSFSVNEKKHCLLVWLCIYPQYWRLKYKKQLIFNDIMVK